MTSANNLGLGKSNRVREIKIRNLTRILQEIEEGTSVEDWEGKEDERAALLKELRSDIERLKDAMV